MDSLGEEFKQAAVHFPRDNCKEKCHFADLGLFKFFFFLPYKKGLPGIFV